MFAPKVAKTSAAGKAADSASRSRAVSTSRMRAAVDCDRGGTERSVDPIVGRSASWDFKAVPVSSPGLDRSSPSLHSSPLSSRALQPVLTVAPPSDPLEREADAAADHVIQKPDCAPTISVAQVPHQRRLDPDSAQIVHSESTGMPDRAVNGSAAIDVLRSPGRPLDSGLRAFMELRFRKDFSQVRVHDDALAASAARAADAFAFTAGHHIAFSQPFDPSSQAGRRLLAHELTHVAQQSARNGRSGPILLQRQGPGAPSPATQLPQPVIGLLAQTDGGQWALKVMTTYGVRLILTQKGRPAYYDANANECTVNVALAPAVVASYFVHEMYHAQRERTGHGGDPKKMEKEPFIKAMVNEEIQGTVRGYQAYLELEQKGQVPSNAPRPPRYESYKSAYQAGRERTLKDNPRASEAEVHAGGLTNAAEAIRWYVWEGGLGPFEGVSYAQFYAEEWKKAHR